MNAPLATLIRDQILDLARKMPQSALARRVLPQQDPEANMTPRQPLTLPDVQQVELAQADLSATLLQIPEDFALPEATAQAGSTGKPEPVPARWPITNETQAEAWGQEWLRCDAMEDRIKTIAKSWLEQVERRRAQLAYLAGGFVHRFGAKEKVRLGTVETWAEAHKLPRTKYAQTMTCRFQFRAAKESLFIPEDKEEELLIWIAEHKLTHLREQKTVVKLDALKEHIKTTGEIPTIHTDHGDVALCEYFPAGRYDELSVTAAGAKPSPFREE